MFIVEVLIGGILKSSYLVPTTLGFALLARHGRYLPLWIPQCGAIAAYLAYFVAEHEALPSGIGVGVALAGGLAIGALIHALLFRSDIAANRPYPALLKGIALIVMVESVLGLLTRGYALPLKALQPDWKVFLGWPVNDTLRVADFVSLGNGILLTILIALGIRYTRFGLAFRAASSDRRLASQYGLPVRHIDRIVVALAALLCSGAGIVYGLKYALTPQMMTAPGFKVVAVVVAVGPTRILTCILAILIVGMLEAVCQSSVTFSAFEHGVAFAGLIIALVVRHLIVPAWRARRSGAKPAIQSPRATNP